MGKSLQMSLKNDRTRELWSSFMPFLKRVENRKGTDLFSMQKFDKPFDPIRFDPAQEFVKWAAVQVKSDHNDEPVPEVNSEFETYTIAGGLYAVFKHIGPASEFGRSMGYIFGEWLPNSSYELDTREHFEILSEGYRPDDRDAEEEIWIPIRKK